MVKAVVWGVEDTLLELPKHIINVIPVRAAEAVAQMVPPGTLVDATKIQGMAKAAFNKHGMPCKEIAAAYNLHEGELTAHMYNLVARNDVWPSQGMFARGNQHWINLFEKSKADDRKSGFKGVKHYAITSGSGEWGQRVTLQAIGLARFMSGVVGSEIIRNLNGGALVNRFECGAKAIGYITRDHNPADVLVVDSAPGYVADARAAGFQAVQLTKDMTVADVFEKHLNITADSRRGYDDHIWAGVNVDTTPKAKSAVQRLRA